MLLSHQPVLHNLNSVRTTDEPSVYVANIHAEIEGIRDNWDFVSRPDDPFGLGPEVRAAIEEWIAAGNQVEPARSTT